MNLQHLKTFHLAASLGSFQAVAEELNYAPPTITLHIQQLEKAWGVQLFERKGRSIRLTNEGRVLLYKTKPLLWDLDDLERTILEIREGEAGHIRIGSIEPTATWRLAPLLSEFSQAYPRLQLNFEINCMYSIADRVASGDLDVGICSPKWSHMEVSFEPLFEESVLMIVSEAHPLAKAGSVSLEDILEYRLVFSEPVLAYGDLFNALLELRNEPDQQALIEINNVFTLKAFIQNQQAIGFVPAITQARLQGGVSFLQLKGMEIRYSVGLIQRKKSPVRTPLVVALMDAIRGQLAAPAIRMGEIE